MPGVIRNLGFRQRLVEPPAVIVMQVSSGIPKGFSRVRLICTFLFLPGFVPHLRPFPFLKSLQSDGVKRRIANLLQN
jgi:hypothetical protein